MKKPRFQKTIEYLKYWKGINETHARIGDKYKIMKTTDARKQNAEIIKEIEEAIAILEKEGRKGGG